MDEKGLRKFLIKGGRSQSAAKRCVAYVREFERYLQEHRGGKELAKANAEDLEAFVLWVEKRLKTQAKVYLWAIRYYYEYTSNEILHSLAGKLRHQKIKRIPFKLKKFRGVDPEHVEKLAAVGIRNIEEMLEAGRTQSRRKKLTEKTRIPLEAILEFVKLSDLARIPGIKSIRARLYCDAGVDSIQKMAKWNPKELRRMLIEFVERTGFDGIAPLPKEAKFSVEKARKLPKMVEY